jgi:hypothetical protein
MALSAGPADPDDAQAPANALSVRIVEHDPSGGLHIEGIGRGVKIEVITGYRRDMAHVLITGWNPGLRKVALDRLLHEKAGLGLHEAHNCVTRLLSGEHVSITLPTLAAASALAEEARTLGAQARAVGRGDDVPAAPSGRQS